jgi:hypothetical protein
LAILKESSGKITLPAKITKNPIMIVATFGSDMVAAVPAAAHMTAHAREK